MLERQIDSFKEDENLNKLDSNNSNKNDNLYNNIINKATSSNRTEELLGSEEIFITLKKEIETTKKRNEAFHLVKDTTKTNNETDNKTLIKSLKEKANILSEEIDLNNNIKEFDIKEDNKVFEYSSFNSKENSKQSKKQFEFNNNWKTLSKNVSFLNEMNESKKEYEYIELNNTVLRLIKEIDYDELGLELKLSFNLIGESQLLIFTRCFVNKDINESNLFDNASLNIDSNEVFNKYTSLIKIMKEMKNNRCIITFGTYYNDSLKNNKLCHKFFLKRQLIDYSEEKKENHNSNDVSEFNMIINDFGEEIINTRIFMNNSTKPNDISGNFFIPINKKAKVMLLGKGTSVRIKELSGKIFNKRNEEIKNLIKFESENSAPKNCECCNIV